MITLEDLKQIPLNAEDFKKPVYLDEQVVVEVVRVKHETGVKDDGDAWTREDVFVADGEYQGKVGTKKIGVFGADDPKAYKLLCDERCVASGVSVKGYKNDHGIQRSYSAKSIRVFEGDMPESKNPKPVSKKSPAPAVKSNGMSNDELKAEVQKVHNFLMYQLRSWMVDCEVDWNDLTTGDMQKMSVTESIMCGQRGLLPDYSTDFKEPQEVPVSPEPIPVDTEDDTVGESGPKYNETQVAKMQDRALKDPEFIAKCTRCGASAPLQDLIISSEGALCVNCEIPF